MLLEKNDLIHTIEHVNEKLYKANEDFDQKETDWLFKTKEKEYCQLSGKFDHHQLEFEELQMEKANLSKNNYAVKQYV